MRTPALHLTSDAILVFFFANSTTHALQCGSKGLVIGARGGTVSEDALLGHFLLVNEIIFWYSSV
jgi:hypothetical protein